MADISSVWKYPLFEFMTIDIPIMKTGWHHEQILSSLTRHIYVRSGIFEFKEDYYEAGITGLSEDSQHRK